MKTIACSEHKMNFKSSKKVRIFFAEYPSKKNCKRSTALISSPTCAARGRHFYAFMLSMSTRGSHIFQLVKSEMEIVCWLYIDMNIEQCSPAH